MSARRFALAAAFLLAAGCSQLKPGRCDHESDCDKTHFCDMNLKTCVPKDAGAPPVKDAGSDAQHDVAVDKGPPSCLADASLCSDPNKPFCGDDGTTCRSCRDDNECEKRFPSRPLCSTHDGAGVCVECLADGDCHSAAASACSASNTCVPCSKDAQCANFGPGICVTAVAAAGDAGAVAAHCASSSEAIYVNKTASCSDTVPAASDAGTADGGTVQPGSATRPFCTMEPIRGVLGPRNVVFVSGTVSGASWSYNDEAKGHLLIAGAGTIAGAASPGFQMKAGDVTIRGITFSPGASVGVQADGGTLHLDRVTVKGCLGGGIWLNGAGFDIQNTTVTGNGPGTYLGFTWGGILETMVPAGGPKNITQSSVANNVGTGITCSDMLTGREILAFGNTGTPQVSSTCSLLTCADAGAMCGAQP